jgi:hypothetical protein
MNLRTRVGESGSFIQLIATYRRALRVGLVFQSSQFGAQVVVIQKLQNLEAVLGIVAENELSGISLSGNFDLALGMLSDELQELRHGERSTVLGVPVELSLNGHILPNMAVLPITATAI